MTTEIYWAVGVAIVVAIALLLTVICINSSDISQERGE